jgi:hypothetical protein
MNNQREIDTSQGLEHKLAQSIEKVRGNLAQSAALKKQIRALRRGRRQIEAIPDDVAEWFKETEQEEEDDE